MSGVCRIHRRNSIIRSLPFIGNNSCRIPYNICNLRGSEKIVLFFGDNNLVSGFFRRHLSFPSSVLRQKTYDLSYPLCPSGMPAHGTAGRLHGIRPPTHRIVLCTRQADPTSSWHSVSGDTRMAGQTQAVILPQSVQAAISEGSISVFSFHIILCGEFFLLPVSYHT